ncbi:MAG: hypothetical protein ACLUW8_01910 [Subdoligranulum sp.]
MKGSCAKADVHQSECGAAVACGVSMAFDRDDKLPVPKMPDLWEKLLHMQGENVTLRSGVFRLKEAPRQPHIFRVPQIRTWNTLLKDGYPEAVKQEAMTLLDEMSARGEMNADSLRSFYQDFMQMTTLPWAAARKRFTSCSTSPKHWNYTATA